MFLHNGSPACPRDKPSLSLGQTGSQGGRKSLCVKSLHALLLARDVSLQDDCWRLHDGRAAPKVRRPVQEIRLGQQLSKSESLLLFGSVPVDKVFGQDIPGTSGTQTSRYPGQKLDAIMQVAFFCCFRQGVAGMFGDLGRDSGRPGLGKKNLCKKTLG